jgi:trehalose 6-phosphate phosphatase
MMPSVKDNSALFLDIDGTILDMAATPEAVVVPPELTAALARLAERLEGALALVSGRSLAMIDRLFLPFRPAAVGCHGAEVRNGGGMVTALAPPIPDTVRMLFRELAGIRPGLLLEDKIHALALHYRQAPEALPELSAAIARHQALFRAEQVGILSGKAVIDARPLGVDKGAGVRALLAMPPFAGRIPLYGGDDTTDQDVFRILPQLGGEGFSVGKAFAGVRYMFDSPASVRRWLAREAEQDLAA